MKKIVVIAVAATCLLGCKKELHDPLLRQQLTTMVASLNEQDDSAAKKAEDDIAAILAVNSAKMSMDQSNKLASAEWNCYILSADLSTQKYDAAIGRNSRGLMDDKKELNEEISDLVSKTKELISQVAATF